MKDNYILYPCYFVVNYITNLSYMLRFVFKNKEEEGEGKEARTFWIYAFGEFVLVFLGILIALQVDNWNQDRRVRRLETVMLGELFVNLKNDLADLDTNINIQTSATASIKIALAFIDGDETWHDSLATHFGELTSGTIFFENISSYESLKSLGIDLISTDSLRQQITHTFETMSASIAKQLYMVDLKESYVPLDKRRFTKVD